jgi:plastocyanin
MLIVAARHFWKAATTRVASVLPICKNSSATRVIIPYRRFWRPFFTGAFVGLACAFPFLVAIAAEPYIVTQKGQMFNPGELSINQGDTVEIVNDDGELIHHAYVDSKTFSFDSGDQEPGSKTDIVFSVPGHFVVLCGIHPKMRLDVTVK